MSAARVRVASWPAWYAPNRYLDLFYQALAPYGIEHVRDLPLDARVLASADVAVSHLHWPEPFWREHGHLWWSPWLGLLALGRFLTGTRRAGIRILWTVHNLEAHEGLRGTDRAAYRLLHRDADLRIFHSRAARDEALVRYRPGGDSLVMPHGNYDGAVPVGRSSAETRRALGVPSGSKLLLCFGQVRAYKGFDVALAAFDYLESSEFQLVIAGRPVDRYADALRAHARGRPNVTVWLEDIEDQRLADLLAAADAVVLPYLRITGSGVLLHALTAGKGVITSDLPYFREILNGCPEARVLAPPGDARALATAIREFFAQPPAERGIAARAIAAQYAWPAVVEPVARWLLAHATSSARHRRD